MTWEAGWCYGIISTVPYEQQKIYRQIILFQRIYYLSISLTGLPCHREPSIVLMSVMRDSSGFEHNWNTNALSTETFQKYSIVCKTALFAYRLFWERLSNFYYNFKKGSPKNFQWVLRLWVGRRKVPLIGYVPKKGERRLQAVEG